MTSNISTRELRSSSNKNDNTGQVLSSKPEFKFKRGPQAGIEELGIFEHDIETNLRPIRNKKPNPNRVSTGHFITKRRRLSASSSINHDKIPARTASKIKEELTRASDLVVDGLKLSGLRRSTRALRKTNSAPVVITSTSRVMSLVSPRTMATKQNSMQQAPDRNITRESPMHAKPLENKDDSRDNIRAGNVPVKDDSTKQGIYQDDSSQSISDEDSVQSYSPDNTRELSEDESSEMDPEQPQVSEPDSAWYANNLRYVAANMSALADLLDTGYIEDLPEILSETLNGLRHPLLEIHYRQLLANLLVSGRQN